MRSSPLAISQQINPSQIRHLAWDTNLTSQSMHSKLLWTALIYHVYSTIHHNCLIQFCSNLHWTSRAFFYATPALQHSNTNYWNYSLHMTDIDDHIPHIPRHNATPQTIPWTWRKQDSIISMSQTAISSWRKQTFHVSNSHLSVTQTVFRVTNATALTFRATIEARNLFGSIPALQWMLRPRRDKEGISA